MGDGRPRGLYIQTSDEVSYGLISHVQTLTLCHIFITLLCFFLIFHVFLFRNMNMRNCLCYTLSLGSHFFCAKGGTSIFSCRIVLVLEQMWDQSSVVPRFSTLHSVCILCALSHPKGFRSRTASGSHPHVRRGSCRSSAQSTWGLSKCC